MNPKPEKNPAAVALGKLAKGRPKKYSKEELEKRTARLPHTRKPKTAREIDEYLSGNLPRKGKK